MYHIKWECVKYIPTVDSLNLISYTNYSPYCVNSAVESGLEVLASLNGH